MRALNLFITIYLVGYVVFTTKATFGVPLWDNTFFVWQDFSYGGVLAWAALYYTGNKEVRAKVKWLYGFSGIMMGWQIISMVTGIAINNEWAVMSAFLLLVCIISVFLFRELKS